MRARKPCWFFRVRFERCKVRFISQAPAEAAKNGNSRDVLHFVNSARIDVSHERRRQMRIASSRTFWNNGAR